MRYYIRSDSSILPNKIIAIINPCKKYSAKKTGKLGESEFCSIGA